jgi:hypothetical protein
MLDPDILVTAATQDGAGRVCDLDERIDQLDDLGAAGGGVKRMIFVELGVRESERLRCYVLVGLGLVGSYCAGLLVAWLRRNSRLSKYLLARPLSCKLISPISGRRKFCTSS